MPSSRTKVFSVAPTGFSETEIQALERAFRLSGARQRRYVFWPGSGHGTSPHLHLVNADDPTGWSFYQGLQQAESDRAPALLAASTRPVDVDPEHHFKPPFLAPRILAALDRLVARHYAYVPEMTVSDDHSSREAASSTIPLNEPPVVSRGDGDHRPILVVDDCDSVRELMRINLEAVGLPVDFAETGSEALRKVTERAYRMIFLDVMLPDKVGFEVSRAMKREMEIQAPIVMLTSRTSRLDKLRGTLAHADDYITKPATHERIIQVVRQFVDVADRDRALA
jgi:twitching motility two-component system response regulator PilG